MMKNKNKSLFFEFPPVTRQEWKQKIIEELKGKAFDDLIWRTKEGFDIAPFYTVENIGKINFETQQKANTGWEIRQDFVVKDLKETNKRALTALQCGAESVGFDVSGAEITKSKLQRFIAGINFSKHPVHFTKVRTKVLEELVSAFNSKICGSLELSDFTLKKLPALAEYAAKFPAFDFITIGSHSDSATKQLIEILKEASTILECCSRSKISLKKILPTIRFSLSLSSDFFMEIAKLRALRILWINEVNKHEKMKDIPMFIHAENVVQKTPEGEAHYNILRATTMGMAAVIGGCDSLSLKACPIKGKSQSFSERIYRNIQLLLKHESYFDKVNNPAEGSYYVEVLTQKLVETLK